MGAPLFESDIPSAENYVRTQISNDVWRTQSGASILGSLRDAGFSMSDRQFYSIRRDVLLTIDRESQIQSHDKSQFVPASWETSVPTWQIGTRYMYSFRYTVIDDETGQETEGFYSYKSDRRMSIEDLENAVQDDLLFGPVSGLAEGLSVGSVALNRVYRGRR